MKIRHKIRIIYILPVVLIILMGLIFFSAYKTAARVKNKERAIESVVSGIFQLNILTTDYLRHHAERPRKQWMLRYASLTELLDRVPTDEEREKRLIVIIQNNLQETRARFVELSDVSEKLAVQDRSAIVSDYYDRLTGQILIRSQALVSDASRLDQYSFESLMGYYTRTGIIAVSSVVVLMLFIFFITYYLGKSIAVPVTRLHRATEIVAEGNLDYKAAIETPDELGQLSRSFDEMVLRLKNAQSELENEINERKKAEAVIRKSEKKYRDIVETSTEGIWTIDEHANTVFANRRMAELLGYTVEEMTGRNLFEFMDEEDAKEAETRFKQRREGKSEIHDFRFKKKDGSYIWTIVSTCPIMNDNGEFMGALGMVTDITDRKKAEEEAKKAKAEIEKWNRELEVRVRRKTEELEQSQAQLIQSEKLSVIGTMAAGLAHELSSPLAGLLPMLEVHKEKAEKDSEEYAELLLMINAARHMSGIVKDFSVFSRKAESDFRAVSINDAIDETLSFSAARFRQKGIRIQKELSDTLPLIHGNKTQLQQVVINMLSNAIDAMPEGGRFMIKTDMSEDRGKVLMEFADNGMGIEKENLLKIFDPFFTTKREGEGTGLGLSVSYGIIEKHGGEIRVESEPGKGAKFTIYLPAVGPDNGNQTGSAETTVSRNQTS